MNRLGVIASTIIAGIAGAEGCSKPISHIPWYAETRCEGDTPVRTVLDEVNGRINLCDQHINTGKKDQSGNRTFEERVKITPGRPSPAWEPYSLVGGEITLFTGDEEARKLAEDCMKKVAEISFPPRERCETRVSFGDFPVGNPSIPSYHEYTTSGKSLNK